MEPNFSILKRNFLIFTVAASLALVSSAQAETLVTRVDAVPALHCIVEIRSDQSANPGIAGAPTCYPTFSAAIFAATAGTVLLDESFEPKHLTDEMLEPAPEDHTIIGVAYSGSDYSGTSLTWIGHGNCGWFTSYSASSMPSGWDNVISSAIEYAGCANNPYFEHTNFGGASIDCTCATMGVMDNQASSAKWAS